MRVGGLRAGMAMRRGIFLGLAAMAVAMLAAPSVRAQSTLSERLARSMLQGQNGDLHRRFGRMLVDQGRDLEIDPAAGVGEARRTLLRRAALYEKITDFPNAEADLTSAVQLDPPSAELYAARGYFYMRRSRFTDALGDFLLATKLSPDSARARFGVGRAQAALGNYAAALGYYDAAIKLARRDPAYYLGRAEAYIHLDQPRRAWADFDSAIAIRLPRATDRYYAFLGRGYASLMMSDYANAIADFDSAIAIEPRAVSALIWRGYAREKNGQGALALDDYEHATSVDPGDRLARANLQRLRSN
jgi:tetratricopeptide (TPR) repeat protein